MRLLALALVGGLLAAPAPQNVSFAVAEGTVLEKTFQIGSKVTLEAMQQRIDGAVQPSPDLAGMNLYAQQDRKVVILDQYLETGPHRPDKLRRRYQSLSGKKIDRIPLMSGGQPRETTLESSLQGCTVLFGWKEAAQGYSASLIDGKTDVGMDGLREDMDLRIFLPTKEVSKGDTWTVDAGVFDELFTLGGSLGLEDDEGGWFESQLADILEGDILVAYMALDDAGQATLGIQAALPFDGKVQDVRSGSPMDCKGKVTMKGTLLWDVNAGHFHTFDLEADMDLGMHMEAQRAGVSMVVDMDMTFDVTISGSAQKR